MSLPKKSVHIRLSDEEYGMGIILSELNHLDLSAYLALLLSKQLRGEFHVVNIQAKAFRRLGLTGIERDWEGSS